MHGIGRVNQIEASTIRPSLSSWLILHQVEDHKRLTIRNLYAGPRVRCRLTTMHVLLHL